VGLVVNETMRRCATRKPAPPRTHWPRFARPRNKHNRQPEPIRWGRRRHGRYVKQRRRKVAARKRASPLQRDGECWCAVGVVCAVLGQAAVAGRRGEKRWRVVGGSQQRRRTGCWSIRCRPWDGVAQKGTARARRRTPYPFHSGVHTAARPSVRDKPSVLPPPTTGGMAFAPCSVHRGVCSMRRVVPGCKVKQCKRRRGHGEWW